MSTSTNPRRFYRTSVNKCHRKRVAATYHQRFELVLDASLKLTTSIFLNSQILVSLLATIYQSRILIKQFLNDDRKLVYLNDEPQEEEVLKTNLDE